MAATAHLQDDEVTDSPTSGHDDNFLTRPCTLCGQEDYIVAPNTLVQFSDGATAIFICRSCGMTPYFGTYESRYRRLMTSEYYDDGLYTYGRANNRKNLLLRALLEEVDRQVPLAGSNLLDVGCGEGVLLEAAPATWRKGQGHRAVGHDRPPIG